MIHSNTCSRAALQCLTATGHRLCWWGFLISDVRLRVVVNVFMFFALRAFGGCECCRKTLLPWV